MILKVLFSVHLHVIIDIDNVIWILIWYVSKYNILNHPYFVYESPCCKTFKRTVHGMCLIIKYYPTYYMQSNQVFLTVKCFFRHCQFDPVSTNYFRVQHFTVVPVT